MSLDFYLQRVQPTDVFDANITHNLSKMWSEAGCYKALYQSEGKTAQEVLPDLLKALDDMERRPEYFRQFDAHNGWGTYEHALPWLRKLVDACNEYPDATIRVSK